MAAKIVTKGRATKTLPRSVGAVPKPTTKAEAKLPMKRPPVAASRVMPVAIPRRDATGHLDPRYAADLRARSEASAEDRGSDHAFLRKARAHDPLAEELGEEAVLTMTSGEDQSDRLQDLEVEEETGGPFVTTSANEEFASGTDASNPAEAFREPFPTT